MCGICGYITKRKMDPFVVNKMVESIRYRGPNDQGVEHFNIDGLNFGLGHSRLSILDISHRGHQPMLNEDKNLVITYNGEIYNFIELRKELKTNGFCFKTNCDTEVILKAYQMWGTECVKYFNGMFAFAIVDKKQNLVFAARDRFGVKPFYYYTKNEDFVFASELKPIMLFPDFQKEINATILGQYFCQGYISSPNTIFKNTYKLEPGHILLLQDNQIKTIKYWNSYDKYKECSKNKIFSFKEAKEKLEESITKSVQKRMITDVPIGCFLSGGIDSTLVTALAQKNSNEPIKTFTIGFNDPQYNEANVAKEIAKHLGTDHQEMYIDEKDLLDLVEIIPKYYDEPFADSSQIPSMLVAQLAKRDITVVLTGDGGDELFCGYDNYKNINNAQKYDKIAGVINQYVPNLIKKKNLPHKFKRILENNKSELKVQLPLSEMLKMIDQILLYDYSNPYFELEREINVNTWQIKRMLLDMSTSLPDRMLHKVDRASMSNSLETRCPLIDYEVAELSFKIPQKYKCYKNKTKYILKEIAYDYVPQNIINLPKKGFSVPLEKWLKTSLKTMIYDYSSQEYLRKENLFNPLNTKKFLDNYYEEEISRKHKIKSSIIWRYFIFQMWYQTYF